MAIQEHRPNIDTKFTVSRCETTTSATASATTATATRYYCRRTVCSAGSSCSCRDAARCSRLALDRRALKTSPCVQRMSSSSSNSSSGNSSGSGSGNNNGSSVNRTGTNSGGVVIIAVIVLSVAVVMVMIIIVMEIVVIVVVVVVVVASWRLGDVLHDPTLLRRSTNFTRLAHLRALTIFVML